MKKIASFVLLLLLLLPGAVLSQIDTLRICSYNVLKFTESSGASRLLYMRHIMDQIQPDVLVVQEMMTAGGVQVVLDSVFNYNLPGKYRSGPFVDGPDTDNAIFYRSDEISLISNRQLATSLRDISEYVLRSNDVTFRVYSLHLKASSGSSNESRRFSEVSVLRNHLNDFEPGSNFMVLGDFNMYSASEPGFRKLTGSEADNDGRVFDPIDQSGNWHDNPSYAVIHTQSTRTTQFGGGSTGGLDDRFDMILVSESLMSANIENVSMTVLPDSYTSYGNDGDHFNVSIVTGSNNAVDFNTANALHEMSDHLPVYADFLLNSNSIISAVQETDGAPESYRLLQNFPNPFNPATTIRYDLVQPAFVEITVYDTAGRRVTTLVEGVQQAGEHSASFSAIDLTSGVYIYSLTIDGEFEAARKMTVLK